MQCSHIHVNMIKLEMVLLVIPNLINLLTNILLWKSIHFLKLLILEQKEVKKKKEKENK